MGMVKDKKNTLQLSKCPLTKITGQGNRLVDFFLPWLNSLTAEVIYMLAVWNTYYPLSVSLQQPCIEYGCIVWDTV